VSKPRRLPYRTDRLTPVPPFHRRALRAADLERGDLVFYGPMPSFYGIGEVKHTVGRFAVVDFRGTGTCGVHEDLLDGRYLIPLSAAERELI
jgi:hypothetical protein